MKLKFYSRILFAAIITAFTASGCNKDDKGLTPDPAPRSFKMEVKDILPGKATILIEPSDKTATYFYGFMIQTEFDAFGTEKDFLTAEARRVETLAAAQGMTLQDYLKTYGKHGDSQIIVETAAPLTPYYFYVYAIATDGNAASAVFKIEFTSGEAPATAPVLKLNMVPGDEQGLDKDIRLTISGKSTGVTSGKLLLVESEELEKALVQGATLESIIDNDKNGYPFESEELDALNSEAGWQYSYRDLTPGTAYTSIVKVTNAIGSTIESISESTLPNAGSNGPTLDLSLMRGDKEGGNKTTNMTATIKATEAMAGRYGLFQKSQVDAALEQGYTLSYLIENNGAAFTREQMDKVNSVEGFVVDILDLEPNKSYTFIAKVAGTGGTTIKTASATTATGIGPDITLTMAPGDKEGKDTDVNMSVTIKSKVIPLSGRYRLLPTAEWDLIPTPAEALATEGAAFSTAELTALNSEAGVSLVMNSLTPSTSYTMIVEAIDDNGTTYAIKDALTSASQATTSDMTFTFVIDDLAPKAASLTVIPSNDTETYYYDYLPVTELDKQTDAEYIAKLIGTDGISPSLLCTGTNGYADTDFDYLPLSPGTAYYLYAFGYDAETKSATTALFKEKFTTPTGNEPSTDAYSAWLGTWTVTSTSSEKQEGTPVTFEVTFSKKVVNISYEVTGWGITNYQKTGRMTVALKDDGGFRIKNMQEIGYTSKGTARFVGRYFKPSTGKYAMATARIDALIGTLSTGGQSATIAGNTFTIGDDPTEHTVTAMDYYDDRGTSWYSFTALADYKEAGNPVGPYTMTRTSNAAAPSAVITPHAKAPQTTKQKTALAKQALAQQALAPALSSPDGKKQAFRVPAIFPACSASNLKLSAAPSQALRAAAKQLIITQ